MNLLVRFVLAIVLIPFRRDNGRADALPLPFHRSAADSDSFAMGGQASEFPGVKGRPRQERGPPRRARARGLPLQESGRACLEIESFVSKVYKNRTQLPMNGMLQSCELRQFIRFCVWTKQKRVRHETQAAAEPLPRRAQLLRVAIHLSTKHLKTLLFGVWRNLEFLAVRFDKCSCAFGGPAEPCLNAYNEHFSLETQPQFLP
jgi:hypothetical protein